MSDPIRCFEGTAKPHEPFWRFVDAAASESGEAEMELYGTISEFSWFEDDITPKMFKNDLYRYGKNGPITVRINSGGGDVIAASVMRSIMTDYPGKITVKIDGLAASAAVVIAMAGQQVRIMDTAYMMIHEAAIMVMYATLDVPKLKKMADELTAINDGIKDVYAARTKLSTDKVGRMMAAETWMSANEAVSLGFADEIISGGNNKAAGGKAFVNALRNYGHVPPELLARLQQNEATTVEESQTRPAEEPAESEPTPEGGEAALSMSTNEQPLEPGTPEGAPGYKEQIAMLRMRLKLVEIANTQGEQS